MSARHSRSPRFLFSSKNRSKSLTDILGSLGHKKSHYPSVTSVFDIDIDDVPSTPFSSKSRRHTDEGNLTLKCFFSGICLLGAKKISIVNAMCSPGKFHALVIVNVNQVNNCGIE